MYLKFLGENSTNQILGSILYYIIKSHPNSKALIIESLINSKMEYVFCLVNKITVKLAYYIHLSYNYSVITFTAVGIHSTTLY